MNRIDPFGGQRRELEFWENYFSLLEPPEPKAAPEPPAPFADQAPYALPGE